MTSMTEQIIIFDVKRDDGQTIPAKIHLVYPLGEAYSIRIERTIEGSDIPYVNIVFIEKTLTGEYVLINEDLAPLAVVRDNNELVNVLRDVVLPKYDGDLVERIEVWVA